MRNKMIQFNSLFFNFLAGADAKTHTALEKEKLLVTQLFSFIGGSFALVFGLIHLCNNNLGIGIVELVLGILSVLNLLLSRFAKKIELSGTLVLSFMFLLLFALIITGGMNKTGIYWIYTFPILAIFLKRKTRGFYWIATFILGVLGLAYAQYAQILWLAYSLGELRQVIASFLAVTLLVYFYEKVREDNEVLIFASQRDQVKKELLELDLSFGQELQTSLIPVTALDLDQVKVCGYYEPSLGVGGDYYDYFMVDKHKIALIIADVSGKGVSAAMLMVTIRTIFRTVFRNSQFSSNEIMKYLNQIFFEDIKYDQFSTVLIGIYDINTRELYYTSAGFGPLVYYSAQKKQIIEVPNQNLPIGITKNFVYEEAKVVLEPDDLLILFTDGIYEAMNQDRCEFSRQSFLNLIEQNVNYDVDEIINITRDILKNFTKCYEYQDDRTLLLLKVKSSQDANIMDAMEIN
jgi:serine phosphatase RsbU (regulator of sigma subunit)